MDGREFWSHPCESKPDAPSPHWCKRQPLHAKTNGHHLPWRWRDVTTVYVGNNCLYWNLVNDTATFRLLSSDSTDISTWMVPSICSLSKRPTQRGRGRFICRYCGNPRWCIAKKIPWDWNIARATRHRILPVLHCDETSVTGENRRRRIQKESLILKRRFLKVGAKTYPIIGTSHPQRDIWTSTHLKSVRENRYD